MVIDKFLLKILSIAFVGLFELSNFHLTGVRCFISFCFFSVDCTDSYFRLITMASYEFNEMLNLARCLLDATV